MATTLKPLRMRPAHACMHTEQCILPWVLVARGIALAQLGQAQRTRGSELPR
jgi:hypothetical protein